MLTTGTAERYPSTEAELVSRFGIDAALLVAMGGIEKLFFGLSNTERAQWDNIRPVPKTPAWALSLDGSLISWFKSAYGAALSDELNEKYTTVPSSMENWDLGIVLAGNGYGKTTAINHYPDGSVQDLDTLLRASGVMAVIKGSSEYRTHGLAPSVVKRICCIIRQRKPKVLLTQYPTEWMSAIIEELRSNVVAVAAVNLSPLTVWDRVSSDRGWSLAKVTRRSNRLLLNQEHWKMLCGSNSVSYSEHTTVLEAVQLCTISITKASRRC